MTTLQRSSVSFRRQGSSGRIWDDRLRNLHQPKSGELHATSIAFDKSQPEREIPNPPSSAATPPPSENKVNPSVPLPPPKSKSKRNFAIFWCCVGSPA
ncbi:hypothetical protein RHMOL_Rhmol08G0073700 [Rhododendron molle]|uniref:Uncharacterized protein n=1 Tax=Rhododendron molle TaxID=49168 RepID=A0ACC0MLU5_RHOML|nr:hypothetical protein RHMOL_Rhmol08G0073700 [Rhododendron molle]